MIKQNTNAPEVRETTPLDRRIGQRVRGRRLEIGMSQERLADLVGVTFQQIQKYEKGVNRVASGRLFDIATALDAPIEHFFDVSRKTSNRPSEVDAVLATAEGQRLMALFANIKERPIRRKVVELVAALVSEASSTQKS